MDTEKKIKFYDDNFSKMECVTAIINGSDDMAVWIWKCILNYDSDESDDESDDDNDTEYA